MSIRAGAGRLWAVPPEILEVFAGMARLERAYRVRGV